MLLKKWDIFMSIFLVGLIRSNSATCPDESIQWNSHCYFFQSNIASFANAEAVCRQLGGHLASIHNMVTNMFLSQEAAATFYDANVDSMWIGAISLINSKSWTWTDDTVLDFSDWEKGQPTTGANCAASNIRNGQWKSEDCLKTKPFICAVDKNPPLINYCQLGWIYYQPTKSCFGISYRGQKGPVVTTWEDAKTFCKNFDADLPSFHDVNEFYVLQAFIITAMRPIWIGLQSTDNSNTWSWSDGTDVNYLPWFKKNGFPLTMDISCGMAEMSFITNHDCNTKAWVICKRQSL